MDNRKNREHRVNLLLDGVWTTSHGKEIPIEKMHDAHLKNALAFFEDQLEEVQLRLRVLRREYFVREERAVKESLENDGEY